MQSPGNSQQHPRIGSFATRMLWIPVVLSILIASYLVLRAPQEARAVSTVASSPNATAVVARATTPAGIVAAVPASAVPDPATAAHEYLDPVGVGHAVMP